MNGVLQRHIKKLMGFSIVGFLMTVVSLLLVFMGNECLRLNQYVVYFLSYFFTILLSFYLNAQYVWKSKVTVSKGCQYFVIYMSSMVLGLLLLRIFNELFQHVNSTLLSYFTIPFTMAWNYLFANRILTK